MSATTKQPRNPLTAPQFLHHDHEDEEKTSHRERPSSSAPPPIVDVSAVLHRKVIERSSFKNSKKRHGEHSATTTIHHKLAHHAPLLRCQEAIQRNNISLLKKILIEYDDDNNGQSSNNIIGELFTPSMVDEDTGELTFEASPSPTGRRSRRSMQDEPDTQNNNDVELLSSSPLTALRFTNENPEIIAEHNKRRTKNNNLYHHHQQQDSSSLSPSSRFFHEQAPKTTLLHLAIELQGTPYKISTTSTLETKTGQHHHNHLLQPENTTSRYHNILFNNNRNYTEVIEELIFLGAPIWKRNSDGLTPVHLAMRHCPHLIVPLLFQYFSARGENDNSENTIKSEVKSFLRDAIAFQDDFEETIVGKFSPYRVEVIHGLLVLFEDDVDYLRSADGNGKSAIDVLADNKNHIPRSQFHQIVTLLLSSSPSEEQQHQHHHVDSSQEDQLAELEGRVSSSSSLAPFSKIGIFFVHPITRFSLIILLLMIHFVLFLGDFYSREASFIVFSNTNSTTTSNPTATSSTRLLSVGSQAVDLPFIFRVVKLIGANWISINDDILTQENNDEDLKSTRTYLLITRILCIVLGSVVGAFFFAFPVHIFFRDFLKLRIFGAEIVLWGGDDDEKEDENNNSSTTKEEEDFSPATLRLFRESISQSYQPYSDPVTDVAGCGPLQRYFTRRAVMMMSTTSTTKNENETVEHAQIKPMINSRNRLFLFFVGAYVGLFCASYVHDAIVENHIIPPTSTTKTTSSNTTNNTSSDNNNHQYQPWYPLRLFSSSSSSSFIITYHMASMHLFHVTLYCLVLLFLVILDTTLQAIHQGPLFLPILNSHGFLPSRKWIKFATIFWDRYRVWVTISLHVSLLGGLAVFHYFDAVDGGNLLPVYNYFFPSSSSYHQDQSSSYVFVLLFLSTTCVLVDWIVLMQEWTLPNLQSISVVVSDDDVDEVQQQQERENEEEKEKENQQHQVHLEAENSFSLPCLSTRRFGNVFSWLLFIWLINLTIDLCRVYWYLKASIEFFSSSSEQTKWYHPLAFVAALIPLVIAFFIFIAFLIRNSTRIKIQSVFARSAGNHHYRHDDDNEDESSTTTSITCCTCCSDIVCCSCRSGMSSNSLLSILYTCCRSDFESMMNHMSTSSGVRTNTVTRKRDRLFLAEAALKRNNSQSKSTAEGAEKLRNLLSKHQKSDNNENHVEETGADEMKKKSVEATNSLAPSTSSSAALHRPSAEAHHQFVNDDNATSTFVDVSETSPDVTPVRGGDEKKNNNNKQGDAEDSPSPRLTAVDEEKEVVELTEEQKQAVSNMNAILDSLRVPPTRDQQEQTDDDIGESQAKNIDRRDDIGTIYRPEVEKNCSAAEEPRLYHQRPQTATTSISSSSHQQHHHHQSSTVAVAPPQHLDPIHFLSSSEHHHHQQEEEVRQQQPHYHQVHHTRSSSTKYHHDNQNIQRREATYSRHQQQENQNQNQNQKQPQTRFSDRYPPLSSSSSAELILKKNREKRQKVHAGGDEDDTTRTNIIHYATHRTASTSNPTPQQQHQQYYTNEEIQFIDQTSQHYRDDYYEKRRRQLELDRRALSNENNDDDGENDENGTKKRKNYTSRPYQQFNKEEDPDVIIARENNFILRSRGASEGDDDDDPQYYSIWEMALTNRVEALRLALIRDPNLVSYIGGPGLRCIELDRKSGKQIINSCLYQQQVRVDLQRREGSFSRPASDHDQLIVAQQQQQQRPFRVIPHPASINTSMNKHDDDNNEVYFAPGRNKADGSRMTLMEQRKEAKRLLREQNTMNKNKKNENDDDEAASSTATTENEMAEYKNFDLPKKIVRFADNDSTTVRTDEGEQEHEKTQNRPLWIVTLLSDETKLQQALREDHEARGGNGELVDYGASLLHYAIYANCPSVVALLLSNGADPMCRTSSGQLTAIDLANILGRWTMGKKLEKFATSVKLQTDKK